LQHCHRHPILSIGRRDIVQNEIKEKGRAKAHQAAATHILDCKLSTLEGATPDLTLSLALVEPGSRLVAVDTDPF
jgi:hypothetical protein